VATVALFFLSSGLVFVLDTAKDAFDIILQVGAGTGLLYLVRWFWWRVNAWCEVVAMISSFLVSVLFLILEKLNIYSTTSAMRLIITIAVTTACWLLAAYFGPQTDSSTLIEFYRKVRPAGPGWETIRQKAGISNSETAQTGDSLPLALIGWVAGCAMIWSSLFTVGNFLYGRYGYAFALLGIFLVSGTVVLRVINKLWTD
jgi:solute:Na+ symporter, SSS family